MLPQSSRSDPWLRSADVIASPAPLELVTLPKLEPGRRSPAADRLWRRATLANGWYLFWWPGAIPAGTKVIGLDALGQEVATSDP